MTETDESFSSVDKKMNPLAEFAQSNEHYQRHRSRSFPFESHADCFDEKFKRDLDLTNSFCFINRGAIANIACQLNGYSKRDGSMQPRKFVSVSDSTSR